MNYSENEGSIGRFISILYRHAQAYITKELRSFNIGSGQYLLLLALSRKNGSRQETLAGELQMDKANVTRAVTNLEHEGYVRRDTDPEDKRAYRIYLTDKGHEVLPIVRKVLMDWNEIISSGFDDNEKSIAISLLSKMAINAGFKWH